MKKQDFAKVRDFMKGKGFIVALALSVAAVGGSAYYAYNSIMNGFEENMGSEDLFVDVDKNQSGIPKDTQPSYTAPKDTPVSETTKAAATEPAATAANNFFPSKSPRVMPVEGEIINPYSDGELVKSQTLNLWQTHDGIDIAAEEGADHICYHTDAKIDVFKVTGDDMLYGWIFLEMSDYNKYLLQVCNCYDENRNPFELANQAGFITSNCELAEIKYGTRDNKWYMQFQEKGWNPMEIDPGNPPEPNLEITFFIGSGNQTTVKHKLKLNIEHDHDWEWFPEAN